MFKKIIKIVYILFRPVLFRISMPLCTLFQYKMLGYLGVRFNGKPKYISAKVWFDGADYSRISIGNRVTISSNIRILTHDWALDTIIEGLPTKEKYQRPIGILRDIEIGDHTFVGTGSIIMPGVKIGKCCIIGAGAVVRGEIPDYSIVIGNPAIVLKRDTISYFEKHVKS